MRLYGLALHTVDEIIEWYATAISRWIASGHDLVTVSKRAGHSDSTTTLRVYARQWDAARRSEDERAKDAASGIGAVVAVAS